MKQVLKEIWVVTGSNYRIIKKIDMEEKERSETIEVNLIWQQ